MNKLILFLCLFLPSVLMAQEDEHQDTKQYFQIISKCNLDILCAHDERYDRATAEKEAKTCSVEPIQQLGEEIGACAQKGLAMLENEKTENQINDTIESYINCVIEVSEKLASEGNIFAVKNLVMLSDEDGKWKEKYDTMKDHEYYQLSKTCSATAGLHEM